MAGGTASVIPTTPTTPTRRSCVTTGPAPSISPSAVAAWVPASASTARPIGPRQQVVWGDVVGKPWGGPESDLLMHVVFRKEHRRQLELAFGFDVAGHIRPPHDH